MQQNTRSLPMKSVASSALGLIRRASTTATSRHKTTSFRRISQDFSFSTSVAARAFSGRIGVDSGRYYLFRKSGVPPLSHSSSPSAGSLDITSPMSTSAASATDDHPVEASITEQLKTTFDPVHLQVINESHMHSVPANSETHFKVVVVSDKFVDAKTLVQRHRLINDALAEQLAGPVHALSIVAKTPEQWDAMVRDGKADAIPPSPNCRGGDGSLPKKN